MVNEISLYHRHPVPGRYPALAVLVRPRRRGVHFRREVMGEEEDVHCAKGFRISMPSIEAYPEKSSLYRRTTPAFMQFATRSESQKDRLYFLLNDAD